MTEPQGTVAVEDQVLTSDTSASVTDQQVPENAVNTEVQAAQAAPAEAKPAGPTEAEVNEAVEKFQALIQGTPQVDAEGNPVTVDDGEGNQRPVFQGDGVLDHEGRDTSTGHLSDALKEQIRTAYVALPAGSSKNSARPRVKEYIERLLGEAIEAMDTPAARTMFQIKNECLTARGSTSPSVAKVEVSPTEAHIARVVAMYLAPYLIPVPDGLDEGWAKTANTRAEELAGQVQGYATWLHADPDTRGDEPEVADEVKAAGRIATGKATRAVRAKKDGESGTTSTRTGAGYSGPKRDIAKHVNEFFDSKDAGYVALLGEIAKFQSNEYGDDRPSPGAISARIWPTNGGPSTLAGIEQVTREGKKAARRVAVSAAPAA